MRSIDVKLFFLLVFLFFIGCCSNCVPCVFRTRRSTNTRPGGTRLFRTPARAMAERKGTFVVLTVVVVVVVSSSSSSSGSDSSSSSSSSYVLNSDSSGSGTSGNGRSISSTSGSGDGVGNRDTS